MEQPKGRIWASVRLAAGLLLAACFLLPAIDFFGTIVPYEVLSRNMQRSNFELALLLVSVPYLFGLLIAILSGCDLLSRYRAVRAAVGFCVSVLLMGAIAAICFAFCKVSWEARSGATWPHWLTWFILWPALGIVTWWSVNAFRRRYSTDAKLAMWQLAASAIASGWFVLVFVVALADRAAHCGIWLSTLSSLVLLACFAVECKHALDCSWKGLLPALMGFGGRD